MPVLTKVDRSPPLLDQRAQQVGELQKSPLTPPDSRAPFAPPAPWRLAVTTLAALAVTALIGMLLPPLMRSLVHALLPSPTRAPSAPLGPHLAAPRAVIEASFIATVLAPFLLFFAWSRFGQPRYVPPRVKRWPSVSILIPAFNEQEMILDAIQGALAQDYPDFEVIVLDDGSTDLTPHLAATTAVRLVRHERNRGKAAALNTGLAVARGEVIVTSDADGYLDPQALSHLVARLSDPQVAAVAGQVRLFHQKGAIPSLQVLEYDCCQALIKQAQCATSGTVLVAPGPVTAFRAGFLREMGGVPSHTLTEDFDSHSRDHRRPRL